MGTPVVLQRGESVIALYNGNIKLRFVGVIIGFRRENDQSFAILKVQEIRTLELSGIGSMVCVPIGFIVSKVYANTKGKTA